MALTYLVVLTQPLEQKDQLFVAMFTFCYLGFSMDHSTPLQLTYVDHVRLILIVKVYLQVIQAYPNFPNLNHHPNKLFSIFLHSKLCRLVEFHKCFHLLYQTNLHYRLINLNNQATFQLKKFLDQLLDLLQFITIIGLFDQTDQSKVEITLIFELRSQLKQMKFLSLILVQGTFQEVEF